MRRQKSTFDDLLIFLGIFREYIGATPRAEGDQGSHKPMGRAPLAAGWGLVGPLVLLWLGSQVLRSSSVPKKIFSGIFFRLDSVSKSPLKGVKNMEKQELALDTELIG